MSGTVTISLERYKELEKAEVDLEENKENKEKIVIKKVHSYYMMWGENTNAFDISYHGKDEAIKIVCDEYNNKIKELQDKIKEYESAPKPQLVSFTYDVLSFRDRLKILFTGKIPDIKQEVQK